MSQSSSNIVTQASGPSEVLSTKSNLVPNQCNLVNNQSNIVPRSQTTVSETVRNVTQKVQCIENAPNDQQLVVYQSKVANDTVNEIPHTVLATVSVRVKDGRSALVPIRLLCDTGSQVNLISNEAFRRLQFSKQPSKCSIVGIGGEVVVTLGRVLLDVWHHSSDAAITSDTFTIIDGMHTQHPNPSFRRLQLTHIDESELADPKYNTCGPIDGILGVNILSRHLGERVKRIQYDLLTQDSAFGWIMFGGQSSDHSGEVLHTVGIVTNADLFTLIRKLWELDELHDSPSMSAEELECEILYKSSMVREEGRYTVSLLLKPDAQLGDSRAMAIRRFYSLEKKLEQQPDLRQRYNEFMSEYQRLGHMREAEPLDRTKAHYYLPHHPVAIQTNFRVVFDASARTSNGKSLNDVQYVGPRMQRDLFDIMMSFRIGRIAMSADIAKMFRQIAVEQSQWDLQRILWRESINEPLREYWLTVVTYGMASSPYNAVKTLNQCAIDNKDKWPQAAEVVQSDFTWTICSLPRTVKEKLYN